MVPPSSSINIWGISIKEFKWDMIRHPNKQTEKQRLLINIYRYISVPLIFFLSLKWQFANFVVFFVQNKQNTFQKSQDKCYQYLRWNTGNIYLNGLKGSVENQGLLKTREQSLWKSVYPLRWLERWDFPTSVWVPLQGQDLE